MEPASISASNNSDETETLLGGLAPISYRQIEYGAPGLPFLGESPRLHITGTNLPAAGAEQNGREHVPESRNLVQVSIQ